MARTGWCRECGEWVEVTPEGGCPNGHGSECVDALHEANAQRAFGSGEMPRSIERFNWGAFFLMPLWGVVHGSAAVIGWWLVQQASALAIASLVGVTSSGSAVAAASSAGMVINIAIGLWVGMNANRWLWRREGLRLQLIDGARPRFSVGRFMSRQLAWLIAGGALTVISMIGLAYLGLSSDPTVEQMRREFMIGTTDITVAAVWTFAEVALAAWLASRMRRETGGQDRSPAAN